MVDVDDSKGPSEGELQELFLQVCRRYDVDDPEIFLDVLKHDLPDQVRLGLDEAPCSHRLNFDLVDGELIQKSDKDEALTLSQFKAFYDVHFLRTDESMLWADIQGARVAWRQQLSDEVL